jgi:hypothetical protein
LEATTTADDDFVEKMLQQWQQAIGEWRLDMDDEFVDELFVDDSDDATTTWFILPMIWRESGLSRKCLVQKSN